MGLYNVPMLLSTKSNMQHNNYYTGKKKMVHDLHGLDLPMQYALAVCLPCHNPIPIEDATPHEENLDLSKSVQGI